ncbi:hypothetical protein H4R34_002474 [Dimargaris verticillata]|uniref:Putative lipoate-protein ligase A n=1 Tax=Dimargaris verticillata TaxID=2761393 RepID=A0A9W8ECV8_9FUNG|nr:hypothetical protein H4R34_002474 [Dimargaris verticillata]
MARKDIWLVRRQSGGGTVYHDLGNSLYTVIMPRDKFSRRFSAELVTRALHMLDIPARVNDRHDIVIGDRKVFPLRGSQTLHNDRASIVTKGVESVRSPVTKLNEFSLTVDHQAFCEAVTDEFNRTYNVAAKHPPVYLDDTVIESIPQIVAYRDKLQASMGLAHSRTTFISWDWLYGQTPEFTNTLHFDATWGTVLSKFGPPVPSFLAGIRYNPKDVRVVFEQLIRELPLFEARGRNQLLDTLAYLEGRL